MPRAENSCRSVPWARARAGYSQAGARRPWAAQSPVTVQSPDFLLAAPRRRRAQAVGAHSAFAQPLPWTVNRHRGSRPASSSAVRLEANKLAGHPGGSRAHRLFRCQRLPLPCNQRPLARSWWFPTSKTRSGGRAGNSTFFTPRARAGLGLRASRSDITPSRVARSLSEPIHRPGRRARRRGEEFFIRPRRPSSVVVSKYKRVQAQR